MEPKIFLLIAAFCMAEVKPKQTPTKVLLDSDEIIEIDRKVYGLTDSVLLTEIKTLWGKKKFQKCLKTSRNNEHKEAINDFFVKTVDAGVTLTNSLSDIYKVRSKNVGDHINNLGHLMQEYPTKFWEINKTNLEGINNLMTEYKYKIEEEFKKLFHSLYGIKKTTNQSTHLKPVENFENQFKKEVEKVKEECDKIVDKIKECINK